MRSAAIGLVKSVRKDPRGDLERLVGEAVIRPLPRRALHYALAHAPASGQAWFQRHFALALMGSDKSATGTWTVNFAGKEIRVPLNGDLGQRWNFAVSIAGHDIEVKELYARLLAEGRLRVVYDIGTNFGTHSLPLLKHGVRTVSVEPNPVCHPLFRELCQENEVTPDLRAVALGEDAGEVQLHFPPDETWLGTVSSSVKRDLAKGHEMRTVTVPMTTLDEMIGSGDPVPDLLKIDTEGHDVAVLKGGRRLLAEHQPLIVFEAWRPSERSELRALLQGLGYYPALPSNGARMSWEAFLTSEEGNFLAHGDRVGQ